MKKTIKQFLFLLLLGTAGASAQVNIGSTAAAHASARLEVTSTNKGLLPPRMTQAQRNAIASPAAGLVVYNTTDKCVNFYNGTGWSSFCDAGIDFITQPVNKRLGGSDFDYATSNILQTSDGGYLMVVNTMSSASGDVTLANKGRYDAWIIKLDAWANIVWQRLYGGSQDEFLQTIQQTTDGGYILAGSTTSSASGDVTGVSKGNTDAWVVKLDTMGNIAWQKNYGGNRLDTAITIKQTIEGGYIFIGYTESSASGDMTGTNKGSSGSDWWIVKLDASGNITWQKNYGGSGSWEWGYDIQPTTDGGYIAVGNSNSSANGDVTGTSKGSDDIWVVKLNATGTIIWQKNYGGSGQDFSRSIQQTTDGGYIVAGSTTSSASGDVTGASKGSNDAWFIKLDALGNITWQKNYGGSGFDQINRIQQTIDGGYVSIGITTSSASGDVIEAGKGGYDFLIIKLDSTGNLTWLKNYGGAGEDQSRAILQTTDGRYIVAGHSADASAGNGNQINLISQGDRDTWIITLDTSGNILAP